MAVTWLERATQPRRFWWNTARDGQGIVLLEALIWQLGKKTKTKTNSYQQLETCKEENHYHLDLFTDHIRNATRTRMLEII